MQCPKCNASETVVRDSRKRTSNDNTYVHRRRECRKCNQRFSTHEYAVGAAEVFRPLMIIKRNGKLEQFDRAKLFQSLKQVYWKTETMHDIEATMSAVISSINANQEEQILATTIRDYVMSELARNDDIAYRRYASAYQQADDKLDKAQGEPTVASSDSSSSQTEFFPDGD